MSDTLSKILTRKTFEVECAKKLISSEQLQARIERLPPARDFYQALQSDGKPRIIAECKRRSPSRGEMSRYYRPVELAQAYECGGAAAISVLTDMEFFGGSLSDLFTVKAHVSVPVLRKDFIIDAYQILEARAYGADSFLLLAGVLDAEAIEQFLSVGRALGMEPLVESHDEAELEVARSTSAKILGINNRSLKTFEVDLNRAKTLRQAAIQQVSPASSHARERVVVCESGIKQAKDVELMQAVGYKVFLIGEALVTHPDPQLGVENLLAASTNS